MKLPHAELGLVAKRKIAEYLLSVDHRVGRGKALFFGAYGFRAEQWEVLSQALRVHAQASNVVAREATAFGMRYVLEGPLHAPDGTELNIRAVWFIEEGEERPRFVTAYPQKRRRT